MSDDLTNADYRALHDHFAERLSKGDPRATFSWLVGVLAVQTPELRSSNCTLVAYTGCPEALDWLEATVGSPVTATWGSAAALLGVSWMRISSWLGRGGPQQLMALDALLAYRAPAPNMSPLAQIAALALPVPPLRSTFDAALAGVLRARSTPRIRKAVEAIQHSADEILAGGIRRVAVADLPRLFLQPEIYSGAQQILDRHEEVTSNVRQSLQNLIAPDRLR